MNPARHISLAKRKALSGTLVFLEAAEPLREEFLRVGLEAGFDMFKSLLQTWTDMEYDYSEARPPRLHDHVSLSEFLGMVVRNVGDSARPFGEGEHRANFERLFQVISDRAVQVSCSRCTEGRSDGQVCRGVDEIDDEIVATGGLCIEPLKMMYDVALGATRAYYLTYGTLVQSADLPEVVFHTGFDDLKNLHRMDIPIYVGGETKAKTADNSTRSDVKLVIAIKDFNWDSYLAALYVLFHECFSHAYHGVYQISDRQDSQPDDAFAEGWMDWVAYNVLESLLKPTPGREVPPAASHLPARLLFHTEHLEAANRFHKERMNWRKYKGEFRQRAKGGQAADKVLYLLEHLRGLQNSPAYNPWEVLLTLSFDLNVVLRQKADGERFVDHVNYHIPARGRDGEWTAEVRYQEPFPRIFTKYLKDNDVKDLLRSVLASPIN